MQPFNSRFAGPRNVLANTRQGCFEGHLSRIPDVVSIDNVLHHRPWCFPVGVYLNQCAGVADYTDPYKSIGKLSKGRRREIPNQPPPAGFTRCRGILPDPS
jgi:hypothetical protein